MTRTFNCPSCGAPLEPAGSSTTIRCPYCSASVIVPEDLRTPEDSGFTGTTVSINGAQVYPAASSLFPAQMQEVTRMLRAGNKIGAIKVYREATGQGLKESKDAVEAIEKLLAFSSAETPEDLAALFSRGERAAQAAASRQSPRGMSKALIGLLVVLAVAGVLIPILLSVIIPAVTFAAVSQQVNVVETVQVNFRTPVGQPRPSSTPQPSPTPGFASLDLAFGGEGIGPGQFQDARSAAVDSEGRIYTVEYTGGRVQMFDGQGKFLSQFRVDGELPVLGLGVDRKGEVYVSQGGSLTRYDPQTGQALGQLKPPGSQSYGHFVFGPNGELAVVAMNAESPDDILILDGSGQVTSRIRGAFSSQTGSPELDMALAFDGLGNLYVLGSFTSAVFKFSPEGRYLTRFGSQGDQPGQFRAVQGITTDHQGRVYVSDIGAIQVFDATGRYLGRIDRQKTVYFGLTTGADGKIVAAGRTMIYRFLPPPGQ